MTEENEDGTTIWFEPLAIRTCDMGLCRRPATVRARKTWPQGYEASSDTCEEHKVAIFG